MCVQLFILGVLVGLNIASAGEKGENYRYDYSDSDDGDQDLNEGHT
jgi:hypothetical protein